eukprot:825142_1
MKVISLLLSVLTARSCSAQDSFGDFGSICTMDVKECVDGSFVSRDGDNNCEFQPCPEDKDSEVPITAIAAEGGNIVAGESNAGEEKTEDLVSVCAMDLKECADGMTFVSRDDKNNCEFESCPEDTDLELEVSVTASDAEGGNIVTGETIAGERGA